MHRLIASGLFALVVLHAGTSRADGESRESRESGETRATRDGRAVVAMMEGSARGLADLLSKTRRTDDPREIACVSDSLSQANVLTRRAKERYGKLREAVARGDQPAQAYLLALLQEDRAMEREATRTAFACVGVLTVPRGRDLVTVKVTVDKNIPPEGPEHQD